MGHNKLIILIVDDEPEVRKVISLSLDEQKFELVESEDGEDALEKIEQYSPDLIILDILIPKIDGWEVTRRMRENGVDTPILMLSKIRAEIHESEIPFKGPITYVPKPFDPTLLGEIIDKVLLQVIKNEEN